MAAGSGKWVPIDEYARGLGITEAQALLRGESGEATMKEAEGVQYFWQEPEGAPESSPSESSGASEAGEEVVMESSSLSRLPLSQEMALQTERALSLVERSLNAFMLMHQEVVQEKERTVERSREGLEDKDQELRELSEKIQALEQAMAEKEQEIADLKMLVGILENRAPRPAATAPSAPLDSEDRANVGDLMEEQLRYIMEEDMVQDLLKE